MEDFEQFKIIDDFLDNPDEIRKKALRCKYNDRNREFPGFKTGRRIVIPGFVERLRGLLPPDVRLINDKGCFQYLTRHRKNYVHADPGLQWMAILTLARTEDGERPDTTFYTHKPTGLRKIPIDDVAWRLRYLTCSPEMDPRVVSANRDRFNYGLWKPTMTVAKKYNRLFLFKPNYYHMGVCQSATTIKNAVLTYLHGVPLFERSK